MTETTKSSQQRRSCARAGCTRLTRSGKTWLYCSLPCRDIDVELTHARALCESLGTTPLSTEWWTRLVEISDLWTKAMQLEHEIWQAAKSVGITRAQWESIKRGQ